MKSSYDLNTVFKFLTLVKKNNDREWFAEHKKQYLQAHGEMILFAEVLLKEMQKQDQLETASGKKSLYGIYNDVRFSKDKLPYKTYLSGGFRRATKWLRGGYYYHIEPGNSYLAGGFRGPNPADLMLIRQHLSADPDTLPSILKNKNFKKTFGTLLGEQVKTAPRGFSIDDPAIELIRHKQFVVKHFFTDAEVKSANFHVTVAKTFKEMRPFFDYMSEILTMDLNGEALSS